MEASAQVVTPTAIHVTTQQCMGVSPATKSLTRSSMPILSAKKFVEMV